jgi:hypothetical protein
MKTKETGSQVESCTLTDDIVTYYVKGKLRREPVERLKMLGLKFASLSMFRVVGPGSQNFQSQICKFFVTLGLNVLRFLRLKVFCEAKIIRN